MENILSFAIGVKEELLMVVSIASISIAIIYKMYKLRKRLKDYEAHTRALEQSRGNIYFRLGPYCNQGMVALGRTDEQLREEYLKLKDIFESKADNIENQNQDVGFINRKLFNYVIRKIDYLPKEVSSEVRGAFTGDFYSEKSSLRRFSITIKMLMALGKSEVHEKSKN